MEDPAKARGFLRVRVLVNTVNPLVNGCWLKRETNRETWVEFKYERLQDFCYRCGHIGHANNECTFEAYSGGAEGYGEWTRAHPVKEFVEPVKPLTLGLGARTRAGEVRGSALQTSLNQGQVPRPTPFGGNDTGSHGSEVEETSSGRDKKKWRRLQRSQVSSNQFQWVVPQGWRHPLWELGDGGFPKVANLALHQLGTGKPLVIIRDINEEASHHSEVVDIGGLAGVGVRRHWMPPNLLLNEASNLKRGVDPQNMDMTQSPQKKVRGTESEKPTKGKMVENSRGLSMMDRCVVVKRTIFTEDELHAVLLELYEKWDSVDENLEAEKWEILAKTSGKQVQGGGGWPSTAARSP
ncbi:hypothetical protein ACFX2I_020016 [Malus domestica]